VFFPVGDGPNPIVAGEIEQARVLQESGRETPGLPVFLRDLFILFGEKLLRLAGVTPTPVHPRPWRMISHWGIGLLCLVALVARAELSANQPASVDIRSDYLVDQWQTDDGLPQNSATSIAQTPNGYLWFGTFNGLVRFDGVRFTVFDSATRRNSPAVA